jgi:DNA-binding NarL/FixJ family response regulator
MSFDRVAYDRQYFLKNREHLKRLKQLRRRKARLITLFCEGKTRKEIARILGMSQWNVSHRLRQCGVTLQREQDVRDKIRAKSHRDRDLYRHSV